jgi:hypothetical protein
MAKIANISYAVVDGFPAGSAVDHVAITVKDPNGVKTVTPVPSDTPSFQFDAPIVGTYTASAQGVALDGSFLGAAVSVDFVVSTPATVSLSLPSAISVVDAA